MIECSVISVPVLHRWWWPQPSQVRCIFLRSTTWTLWAIFLWGKADISFFVLLFIKVIKECLTLICFMSLFSRFPAPILPTVSQWEDMLSTAFSLAIVGYVINLAMGRTLAAKHGYDVNSNQV